MLFPFEFPDGFRAGVEMRGFDFGQSRQPQTPKQQADRAALQSVLQCMLADAGLVEPPPGGCAVRTGNLAADKAEQIVVDVLDALRTKGIL